MKAKKILNFLILRPALTRSNFTTIALVAFFFVLYMALGGTVAPLPKLEDGGSFGSVSIKNQEAKSAELTKDQVDKYLGLDESADRRAREEAINQRGLLHNADVDELEDPLDEEDLQLGEEEYASREEIKARKLEQANKKAASISDLENRLKKIR